MTDDGLQFVGPAAGRWLQEELTGFGGLVGYTVPGSFPACARVLHRIDPDGAAIRWSQVCEFSASVAHPLMQWGAICRGWGQHYNSPHARSSMEDPSEGDLDPISMAALYEVLQSCTATEQVFHGFWNGWGRPHPGSGGGPTLVLPSREYLVWAGALDVQLFGPQPPDIFWHQSPSLTWPANHSWCVATEIDFDSTLVAGPVELIDAVLKHPELEAWPVKATDSLTFDADVINTLSSRAFD